MPYLLSTLAHNPDYHVVHHCDSLVPSFNAKDANNELVEQYTDLFFETKWNYFGSIIEKTNTLYWSNLEKRFYGSSDLSKSI